MVSRYPSTAQGRGLRYTIEIRRRPEGAPPFRNEEVKITRTGTPISVEALEMYVREKLEADNVPGLSVGIVKADPVPGHTRNELPVVLDDEDRDGHGRDAAS